MNINPSKFSTWTNEQLRETVDAHIDKLSFAQHLGRLRAIFVQERTRDELIAFCDWIEEEAHLNLSVMVNP